MLTDSQKLDVFNDFIAWAGDLPEDPQHVIEYMLVSYALNYPEEAATAYLMTEILQS